MQNICIFIDESGGFEALQNNRKELQLSAELALQGKSRKQPLPALHVIAVKPCLLLAQYYLETNKKAEAMSMLQRARSTWDSIIGHSPVLEKMLSKAPDGQITGYFKPYFEALAAVQKNSATLTSALLQPCIPMYPFNYE